MSNPNITEDQRIAATAQALGWISVYPHSDADGSRYPGIALRQYFAAMAMQGLSAGIGWAGNGGDLINPEALAIDAVACADALLKELAK